MSKKVLKLEKKEAPKVKITNFMIERFEQDESFKKLRCAIGVSKATKMKIYRVAEILMNSAEYRAFNKLKDELIKATALKNEQIEKIEEKERLTLIHPEVIEIMNLESGLEMEKLTLQESELPADFHADDMMVTSWLIEYVDDTKN